MHRVLVVDTSSTNSELKLYFLMFRVEVGTANPNPAILDRAQNWQLKTVDTALPAKNVFDYILSFRMDMHTALLLLGEKQDVCRAAWIGLICFLTMTSYHRREI